MQKSKYEINGENIKEDIGKMSNTDYGLLVCKDQWLFEGCYEVTGSQYLVTFTFSFTYAVLSVPLGTLLTVESTAL